MQVKTVTSHGYTAVQLGYGDMRTVYTLKPSVGHAKKAHTTPKRFVRTIRDVALRHYTVGSTVKAHTFAAGTLVDVTGTSKGTGYQGNIKLDGQSRGPMAHGSRYTRRPGSLGAILNKVFKGKLLPGRMGNTTRTLQNLQVVAADTTHNVLYIKGNVPGANKSFVTIRSAVKAAK